MKPNFEMKNDLRKGNYEYPGFVPATDVHETWTLRDGNTIVQDNEGRLYNVHPRTNSRWRTDLRENEACPPCYPIRWQLSRFDVPADLTKRLEGME